jgi:amino acid transporter
MIGTMNGAGIFVITGTAAEIMGPAVLFGFLAVIPLIIVAAFIYSIKSRMQTLRPKSTCFLRLSDP